VRVLPPRKLCPLHGELDGRRQLWCGRRWMVADDDAVLRTEQLVPNRSRPLYTPLPSWLDPNGLVAHPV